MNSIGCILAWLLGTATCHSAPAFHTDSAMHNVGYQPVAASPRQAWNYALLLVRQHGLPPDAILTEAGGGEREISVDAKSPSEGHQLSYDFVWQPAVIGSDDRITISVASGEYTHCTRSDCSAYNVTYRLTTKVFFWVWTPADERTRAQEALRERLVPVAAPTYVNSSCPGNAVDVTALRRVAAGIGDHADTKGIYRPIVEQELLKIPGWVYARFAPFVVHHKQAGLADETLQVEGAAVGDLPATGTRYLELLTRERFNGVTHDWWRQFVALDNEAVCLHSPRAHSLVPNLSPIALTPQLLPGDALERSQDEALWTRKSMNPGKAQLLSLKRTRSGTQVMTSIQQNDGTWRGTFWYDRNGVATGSSFLREDE
jgi:hypothetical protein